jgi:hypothetical protein
VLCCAAIHLSRLYFACVVVHIWSQQFWGVILCARVRFHAFPYFFVIFFMHQSLACNNPPNLTTLSATCRVCCPALPQQLYSNGCGDPASPNATCHGLERHQQPDQHHHQHAVRLARPDARGSFQSCMAALNTAAMCTPAAQVPLHSRRV